MTFRNGRHGGTALVGALLVAAVVACGGDDGESPTGGTGANGGGGDGGAAAEDFGQYVLSSADEACEGVDGVTGQVLVDQRPTGPIGPKASSYVDPQGGAVVGETSVTVTSTWPSDPAFVCYPAYELDGVLLSGPRIVVALDMHFVSEDGAFDEELAGGAMLQSFSEQVQAPFLWGVRRASALVGTYDLDPALAPMDRVMVFRADTDGTFGTVGISTAIVDAPVKAGALLTSAVVLTWP